MACATGLHTLHDSGIPAGSADYTTVVILHGYAWHSASFKRFLSLAGSSNVRMVLVNRRDYPGARPYSEKERALLPAFYPESSPDAEQLKMNSVKLLFFMEQRAREVYDFLVEMVEISEIPLANPANNSGGIILAGWSFGTVWMTAFLTHVSSFNSASGGHVDLSEYVRRVVLYEPLSCLLGYQDPPRDPFCPVRDPSYAMERDMEEMMDWISGYYAHGDTLDTLERRTPLGNPPPTLRRLSAAEMQEVTYPPPGCTGGSDKALLDGAVRTGLFGSLRRSAIRRHCDEWKDVEMRVVWAEQSVWEVPYMIWCLQAELEAERAHGRPMRDVTFSKIRGANHFAQWDYPEETLQRFLANADDLDK